MIMTRWPLPASGASASGRCAAVTMARSIRETRALVNAFLDKAVAARVINQKSNVSPLLDRLRLSSPRLTRRGLPLSRAERVPTRGRESFDVHTASPPPPRRAIVRPRPLVVGSRPSRRPRALSSPTQLFHLSRARLSSHTVSLRAIARFRTSKSSSRPSERHLGAVRCATS